MILPEGLRSVVEEQDGLVSCRQLTEAGVSGDAVRWRLGRRWRLVLPGVVATFTGRMTRRQQLVAALLYAGEGGMLTSTTAAAWHGLGSVADPRVHVEVPARRWPRGAGFVVVRRTTRPDLQPWRRPPLLVVSRARAVVAAARDAPSADAARAVVIEAVQRRIVRVEEVRHELEAGPRPGSARVRRAVQAAEAGAWSIPEVDLAALVRASPVLPDLWLNPALRGVDGSPLPRPDGWFDDVALAVQVHSLRFHGDPEGWDGTVMSDGILVEHGVVVLGVTPRSLRSRPEAVLRRIEQVHALARRRPRPAVEAVPVGHGVASS